MHLTVQKLPDRGIDKQPSNTTKPFSVYNVPTQTGTGSVEHMLRIAWQASLRTVATPLKFRSNMAAIKFHIYTDCECERVVFVTPSSVKLSGL